MSERIQIILGDITSLDVDGVVNAVNNALSGGGGVDGSTRRGAGPRLSIECSKLGRCDPGGAKITGVCKCPSKPDTLFIRLDPCVREVTHIKMPC